MAAARLPAEQRDFFTLVSRAAFSNPFSRERDDLDKRIVETEGDDPDLIARLIERLSARLAALGGKTRLDIRDYGGDDRELLEHALFFEVFHRFGDAFDALIERQLRAGRTPLPVDFAPDVLRALVERGVEPARALRAFIIFFQMRRAFHFIAGSLTGRSPSMGALRESLWSNVFTRDVALYERFLWDRMEDFSTILLGETGTGKGAAAAAIGRSAFIPFDEKRRAFEVSFTETFVPLNLSQFPETLIESELFGHKKGAFTGAVDSHEGVFSRCSPWGSIFLDEIGEVSVPVQIKLLNVLQDRVFAPVGSHEEGRFEGRVIAATHRSLDELRREKRFRDDFYYRLCSDVIRVPPLRRRLAEDPRELNDLLGSIVARMVGEPSPSLVALVEQTIARDLGPAYPWPGNVRELEQCVRRILLTGRCEAHAGPAGDGLEGQLVGDVRSGTLDARALLSGYCALLHERLGTYEAVAKVTGLDRRTVKKHVLDLLRTSR